MLFGPPTCRGRCAIQSSMPQGGTALLSSLFSSSLQVSVVVAELCGNKGVDLVPRCSLVLIKGEGGVGEGPPSSKMAAHGDPMMAFQHGSEIPSPEVASLPAPSCHALLQDGAQRGCAHSTNGAFPFCACV